MKLRRLCKSISSRVQGDCPAVYVAEDPARMVTQGAILDAATIAELLDIGVNEAAVELPTETVLRAAALFLASQGRPAMVAEVEVFLAERLDGRS